jgi:hypothetical protein
MIVIGPQSNNEDRYDNPYFSWPRSCIKGFPGD